MPEIDEEISSPAPPASPPASVAPSVAASFSTSFSMWLRRVAARRWIRIAACASRSTHRRGDSDRRRSLFQVFAADRYAFARGTFPGCRKYLLGLRRSISRRRNHSGRPRCTAGNGRLFRCDTQRQGSNQPIGGRNLPAVGEQGGSISGWPFRSGHYRFPCRKPDLAHRIERKGNRGILPRLSLNHYAVRQRQKFKRQRAKERTTAARQFLGDSPVPPVHRDRFDQERQTLFHAPWPRPAAHRQGGLGGRSGTIAKNRARPPSRCSWCAGSGWNRTSSG